MVDKAASTAEALLLEEKNLKEKLITLLQHRRAELPSNFKAEWKHLSDRLDSVISELEKLGL